MDVPLPMLGGAPGKVYVLEGDKAALLSGAEPAQPLVLHANVGDCLLIQLTNETSSGPVSLHADMLAYDPNDSQGIAAGHSPAQAAVPGGSRTYTWYAHPEIGETTAMLTDWGNILENPGLGLYGAIIVGPSGAAYTDPETGEDVSMKSAWSVDVHPPTGDSYRDFTLMMQDEDEVIGNHLMPYTERVQGVVGINYRAEPLAPRLSAGESTADVFNTGLHGDPSTPVMEAFAALTGEFLGVERAPIEITSDGHTHRVRVGDLIDAEFEDEVHEGVSEPVGLINTLAAFWLSPVTISPPTKSIIKAFGMEIDNSNRHGTNARFDWSG